MIIVRLVDGDVFSENTDSRGHYFLEVLGRLLAAKYAVAVAYRATTRAIGNDESLMGLNVA